MLITHAPIDCTPRETHFTGRRMLITHARMLQTGRPNDFPGPRMPITGPHQPMTGGRMPTKGRKAGRINSRSDSLVTEYGRSALPRGMGDGSRAPP